jgi:hypothetical protein
MDILELIPAPTSKEFILFLIVSYLLYGMLVAIDRISIIKGIERGTLIPMVYRPEYYYIVVVLPTLPMYRKFLLYSLLFISVSLFWLYTSIKERVT